MDREKESLKESHLLFEIINIVIQLKEDFLWPETSLASEIRICMLRSENLFTSPFITVSYILSFRYDMTPS